MAPNATAMDYRVCTESVRRTVLQLAGQRRTKVLAAGPTFSMTRICTDDANLLITCSAPDRKQVITQTAPNRADCM